MYASVYGESDDSFVGTIDDFLSPWMVKTLFLNVLFPTPSFTPTEGVGVQVRFPCLRQPERSTSGNAGDLPSPSRPRGQQPGTPEARELRVELVHLELGGEEKANHHQEPTNSGELELVQETPRKISGKEKDYRSSEGPSTGTFPRIKRLPMPVTPEDSETRAGSTSPKRTSSHRPKSPFVLEGSAAASQREDLDGLVTHHL